MNFFSIFVVLCIKKLYHLAIINSSIHDVTPLPNKTGIQSIFFNFMDHEFFQNFKHHNLKGDISSIMLQSMYNSFLGS